MPNAISDFSDAEVKQRAARVQEIMKSKGWDVLLVLDEEQVGPGCSVRYLAGMSHIKPPIPGYLVIGANTDPVMIMGGGMSGSAFNLNEQFCPIEIRGVDGFGADLAGVISQALADAGYKGGPLPVDGLNLLRYGHAETFKKNFPNVSFVNATRTVEKVRIHRSEAENANYRRAAELTYNSLEMFMHTIKPGVPQDVAAELANHVSIMQDAEENMLIFGTGTPWVWGRSGRGGLKFEEGDLVACELNARVHGYYAQVGRAWGLGKLAPEKQAIIDAVRAATDKMIAYTRPGMVGKEIFHVGLEEVRRRGFDFNNVRYGHGVGLTIGECFDIADWDGANTEGPCNTPIPVGAHGNFHPFIIGYTEKKRGAYNALWADPWIMGEHGLEFLVPENSRAMTP